VEQNYCSSYHRYLCKRWLYFWIAMFSNRSFKKYKSGLFMFFRDTAFRHISRFLRFFALSFMFCK
jgi:hypothetical protein